MLQRIGICILLASLCASQVCAEKKKKKGTEEEITQTLEVIPDPPSAITTSVETLSFVVSPLSNKGLLSQQVRDGLKAVRSLAKGGTIVKIRAFVAGAGDLRRVQSIVAETFAEKRLTIPALSTIQIGSLPLEGAQVVLEAVVAAKKPENPNGVAFLSGMGGQLQTEPNQIEAGVSASIANLTKAAEAAGGNAANMLRVTCLLSTLETIANVRQAVATAFPQAAFHAVQTLRGHAHGLAECEGVVRLHQRPAGRFVFSSPTGLAQSPNYSQIAAVAPGSIVFSGLQLVFNDTEDDLRRGFKVLERTLTAQKTNLKHVVFAHGYPTNNATMERIRSVRFEFFDKANPPASTMLLFEGLPGLEATAGMEVVAIPE